jgi:hypothetical protein
MGRASRQVEMLFGSGGQQASLLIVQTPFMLHGLPRRRANRITTLCHGSQLLGGAGGSPLAKRQSEEARPFSICTMFTRFSFADGRSLNLPSNSKTVVSPEFSK